MANAIEIKKILEVMEKATEEEKKILSSGIETFSADFKVMLRDSRQYILTGEKEHKEFPKSISALNSIREIGEKYG